MGKKKQNQTKQTQRLTILERTIKQGQQYATTTSRLRPRKKIKKSKKDRDKKEEKVQEKQQKKTPIKVKESNQGVKKGAKPKKTKKVKKIKNQMAKQKETPKKQKQVVKVIQTKKQQPKQPKLINKEQDKPIINEQPNKQQKVSINPSPSQPISKPSLPPPIQNPLGKTVILKKSQSAQPKAPKYQIIDICFCIDATGSMMAQIYQLPAVINNIIQKIQQTYATQNLKLRFAVVSYRDHNPQQTTYVTKYQNFTDQTQSINYLKSLRAFGGGDEPQAIHDALYQATNSLNWASLPPNLSQTQTQQQTQILKLIIHIADAQPHGKQFNNEQQQKQGCTCGLQTNYIIEQINKNNIYYVLIKCRQNSKLDIMERIFKENINRFQSAHIDNAKQLDSIIPNIIIKEISTGMTQN